MTRRVGGETSMTLPTSSTVRSSLARICSPFVPGFSSRRRSRGPSSALRRPVSLWPRTPFPGSREYRSRKQSWSSLWSLLLSFEFLLQIVQQAEPLMFEFPHPPFVDLVERHRVDEMQLFPTTPNCAHQIGRLQYLEVLRGGLPGHVQLFAKLAERLPVPLTKKVKQFSACRVSQRLKNLVSVHRSHSYARTLCRYLPACQAQVFTCM